MIWDVSFHHRTPHLEVFLLLLSGYHYVLSACSTKLAVVWMWQLSLRLVHDYFTMSEVFSTGLTRRSLWIFFIYFIIYFIIYHCVTFPDALNIQDYAHKEISSLFSPFLLVTQGSKNHIYKWPKVCGHLTITKANNLYRRFLYAIALNLPFSETKVLCQNMFWHDSVHGHKVRTMNTWFAIATVEELVPPAHFSPKENLLDELDCQLCPRSACSNISAWPH